MLKMLGIQLFRFKMVFACFLVTHSNKMCGQFIEAHFVQIKSTQRDMVIDHIVLLA